MAWLKKQQPIQLYQASELPYIILENDVKLCFDNCYGTKADSSEHKIHFRTSIKNLRRINTYFYRFSKFPCAVPISDVISLDDAVIEGRTIKHAVVSPSDLKTIAIIKSSYIRNISDLELLKLNDRLDEFDSSFVLAGENIDPQVRLFEGEADIIHHHDWYRTAVSIADKISEKPDRKYCWTHSIPDLDVSCFGIRDADELQELRIAFDAIGIPNISVDWVS